jgi:hypothetical protein
MGGEIFLVVGCDLINDGGGYNDVLENQWQKILKAAFEETD